MELVRVSTRTLSFPLPTTSPPRPTSATLHIENVSATHLAFKMKTTNQTRYIVRPNVGTLSPSESLSILVRMLPSDHPPPPGPCKDRFLLCVAQAPDAADKPLPADYWRTRENDPDVVGIKFRVEFLDDSDPDHDPDDDSVAPKSPAAAAAAAPAARDLPPPSPRRSAPPPASTPATASSPPPSATAFADAAASSSVRHAAPEAPAAPSASGPDGTVYASSRARAGAPASAAASDAVDLPDADELLRDGNYEAALSRVRELQALLDAKTLELARLRTELVETKAESERVLRDAPKTPLSANKLLSDPFGGVSIAGIGLMFLLFIVLVNVIFRIV